MKTNTIPEYKFAQSVEEVVKKYGIKRVIKLSSNESPLGVSPNVIREIKKWAKSVHLYPDPNCSELRREISAYLNIDEDNVIVGNGSDEILFLLSLTFLDNDSNVIIPIPSFSYYEILTKIRGASPIFVKLGRNFEFEEEKIIEKIDKNTKMIFLCSPNNPTGNVIKEKALKKILESGRYVVLDEAYAEFAGQNFTRLVESYDNLIVTRTFSKAFGLAGLRIGYGIASEKIIKKISKIKQPFNVNLLSQKAAIAAIRDRDHLKRCINLVEKEREYVREKLSRYVKVYPSKGNFLLVDVRNTGKRAREVVKELEKKGILVRLLKLRGLDEYFFRVSIGKPKENRKFIREFIEVIKCGH